MGKTLQHIIIGALVGGLLGMYASNSLNKYFLKEKTEPKKSEVQALQQNDNLKLYKNENSDLKGISLTTKVTMGLGFATLGAAAGCGFYSFKKTKEYVIVEQTQRLF